MDKESIRGKRRARKLAVQALYQWQMSGAEMTEVEAQFLAVNNMDKVDLDYLKRIIHGISKTCNKIDQAFAPFLDRLVQELNPIELAVLRLSTFELLFCPEIPFQVVLDEAVTLAKAYGSQDGYRYVNGVLHQLSTQVRTIEFRKIN